MSHPLRPVAWFILLVVVALALNAPVLDGDYYGDDYQFVFETPHLAPFYYFVHANPENPFYRPIQATWLATVQAATGRHTWPIHVASIVLHALLGLFVFGAMAALGHPPRSAALASLLVVASQAAVPAVAGNDTISQLLGTMGGYVSVWLFYRHAVGGTGAAGVFRDPRYLAALALLSLLMVAVLVPLDLRLLRRRVLGD